MSIGFNSSIAASSPNLQPIYFIYPEGKSFTFTLEDIDLYRLDQIKSTVCFAVQIGAALITLLVMSLVTHADKRKTPIFALNITNLAIVIVRAFFYVDYYTGPLSGVYAVFSWDTTGVPESAWTKSRTTSVLSMILMLGIQLSLMLQVKIAWNTSDRWRPWVIMVCAIFSTVAVSAHWAYGIYILQPHERFNDQTFKWARPTVSALVATSISVFAGFFAVRMWSASRNRAQLGFRNFGSLEALCLGGCQILIFPAIFCFIENFVPFGGSQSLAQAIVAINLPISHLWAMKMRENEKLKMGSVSGEGGKYGSEGSMWHRYRNKILSSWGSSTVGRTESQFSDDISGKHSRGWQRKGSSAFDSETDLESRYVSTTNLNAPPDLPREPETLACSNYAIRFPSSNDSEKREP